ncbi:MAG: hypothetical protein WD078_07235 [Woeseia sp.]
MTEITDWTRLREFKAVDLASSFVLSWQMSDHVLVIDLDLCLTPEHPFYVAPRRLRQDCILPAMLEFPHCSRLGDADEPAQSGDLAKIARGIGLGKIHGLQLIDDGHYEMSGDFGTVQIQSERPILRLGDRLA